MTVCLFDAGKNAVVPCLDVKIPQGQKSKDVAMTPQSDLKTILNKLHYSDDAKVVAQISDQTKMVMSRMKG